MDARTWTKMTAKLDMLDRDISEMVEGMLKHTNGHELLIEMIRICPSKPVGQVSSENIVGYIGFLTFTMGIRAMWQRIGYAEAADDG